jgi:signal transduction histidine kinase
VSHGDPVSDSTRPAESGSRTTLVLLSLILVVAAVLGWQAYRADQNHRGVAERVVLDYVKIASAELLTRVQRDVEYYGAAPIFHALVQYNQHAPARSLPSPAELAAASNERQRQALHLARFFFRYTAASGDCTPAQSPVAREACSLIASLAPNVLNERDTWFRQTPSHTMIAFTQTGSSNGAPVLSGFELDRAALRRNFVAAFQREPLLPRPLGVENDALFVEVLDSNGQTLFLSPGRFPPRRFYQEIGVDRPLGPESGELFSGGRMRTSIDAQAIPRLVVGGLPRSRVPLLLLVFGLTLALFAAAVRQVNKERALSRLRSDFVASVSHELRTPLTQIRMFAETLLLDRVRSPLERYRSLEIIDQEARRLSHLVENVLRVAQSDRGKLRVSREPVDTGRLLADTVERFLPLARASANEVQITARDGVFVSADPESLRQVILNLLDNAVKYGPHGQRILVSLEESQSTVQIVVEDQGEGVPVRHRDEIWERFSRLDRDRKSHRAGTGIGLAVVRELLELHDGTAWVEERTSGTGARFVIQLPRLVVKGPLPEDIRGGLAEARTS